MGRGTLNEANEGEGTPAHRLGYPHIDWDTRTSIGIPALIPAFRPRGAGWARQWDDPPPPVPDAHSDIYNSS